MGAETPAGPTVKGSAAEPAGTSESPDSGRLWFEYGDIAYLTFLDDESGETETFRAMFIRPGAWVLSNGVRLPPHPRPVIHIHIVYPPDRIAEESLTHDNHQDTHDKP